MGKREENYKSGHGLVDTSMVQKVNSVSVVSSPTNGENDSDKNNGTASTGENVFDDQLDDDQVEMAGLTGEGVNGDGLATTVHLDVSDDGDIDDINNDFGDEDLLEDVIETAGGGDDYNDDDLIDNVIETAGGDDDYNEDGDGIAIDEFVINDDNKKTKDVYDDDVDNINSNIIDNDDDDNIINEIDDIDNINTPGYIGNEEESEDDDDMEFIETIQ